MSAGRNFDFQGAGQIQRFSAASFTIRSLMGILIFAFVLIELTSNTGLSFLRVTEGISRSEELCIAAFACSERGCIADMSNDPQRVFLSATREPHTVSLREPHPSNTLRQAMLHNYLRKLMLTSDEFMELLKEC
jgi:hypothetical protein